MRIVLSHLFVVVVLRLLLSVVRVAVARDLTAAIRVGRPLLLGRPLRQRCLLECVIKKISIHVQF